MDDKMLKELYLIGLVPVIKIEDPADAVPLAKALMDGGLPAAEITFRTKCAAEAIKNITDTYPDMLVGAGTVLTTEQVDAALAAEGPTFCEIFTDTQQVWEPKSATKRLPDGTLVSPPLEDLAPFLPREELEKQMFIPLVPEQ